MALKTIEERLRDIVEDQLSIEPERITIGARFDEDFGMDSLDAIEISMAVEEEFNIDVNEDEFESVGTFGKFVELIEKKMGRDVRRTIAG